MPDKAAGFADGFLKITLKPIAAGAAAPPLTHKAERPPPGDYQVRVLAADGGESQRGLLLPEFGRGVRAGGDCAEVDLYRSGYSRGSVRVDGESIILRIDPLLYAPPRSGAFFFFGFGTAVTGRSARTTAAASPGLSTSRI